MKKDIQKQIEEGSQAIAKRSQQEVDSTVGREKEIEIFEFVGAAKLMNKITASFGSQLLLGLKRFQESEGYRVYGCQTWVQFLKEHPELDLSKTQYYERLKVLEAEGAELFDLLSSLNVPISARKQLTAGSILVEGNELVIGEQRVPVDDAKKVKRAITQIADQMERLESKAAKTEKEIEKLKQKLAEAKEEARSGGTASAEDGTDPCNQAYLRVLAGLTELGRELAELPGKEADQRMAQFKPQIQHSIEVLFAHSASNAPTRRPEQPDGLGLTQADLAELMED
ncbi:MAG TPA: hypothetical protein PLD20_00820 [Blastocatellia bacterium]|nr:hypothetical protein [Blastocatellia bacterium]HMV81789.1 hypothetical protein [Blastocatellia bacterium]HMX24731.1 hypothetical protein [Blastocatellia bacterium]HMY70688.1 hypothetical protein [Blastocatellia bacterium]HMZ16477.1 hypothetical protein [Blastocatellia bacterium]